MSWAIAAVAIVAALVADYRWLRVSQREHYIPGSCGRILRLWLRVRPPNVALAGVAAAATVLAIIPSGGPVAWAGATVAAVAGAILPWGMPLRGRESPVKFTRRLRTLAAVVVLIEGAIGAFLVVASQRVAALVLLSVLAPVLVDTAAAIARPMEARLARGHRQRAEKKLQSVAPRVIAVTGSYGKTSTKNHIRDLLGDTIDVVASPASWNNTAGLSRAINEHLRPSTDVFIAEMGTYGPGEIRDLCNWIKPEIAVITAIGPMHLERMGTLEVVTQAKAEILEGAKVAVLCVDDQRLAPLATTLSGVELWRCGTTGDEILDVSLNRVGDEVSVRVRGVDLGQAKLNPGLHLGNVACAIAAACAVGLPPSRVLAGLAGLSPPEHRAVEAVSDAGIMVLDDTFNSNPLGARVALNQLQRVVKPGGRSVVITPGMVELGPQQYSANREFGRAVTDAGATLVVVGWTNRTALLEGGKGAETMVVPSRAAARTWVRESLHSGDAVLWENDLPDHYP